MIKRIEYRNMKNQFQSNLNIDTRNIKETKKILINGD